MARDECRCGAPLSDHDDEHEGLCCDCFDAAIEREFGALLTSELRDDFRHVDRLAQEYLRLRDAKSDPEQVQEALDAYNRAFAAWADRVKGQR